MTENGTRTKPDDLIVDLTKRCPTCGRRADMCFDHGDVWKKRERTYLSDEFQRMTDDELRASVNEFTEDDPPPYAAPAVAREDER